MPTTTPPTSRLRRSDAERNHARIVVAARAVLAERGADAKVEEIARRAGLGVGSLYRHFPDKAALVDAVLDDAFGEILALADTALDMDDAWAGFSGFVEGAVALHAANSGLRDIVAGSARGRERAAAMRARLRPKVRRLVARAHIEGGLRRDFVAEDVPLLFWGTGKVIDLTSSVAPEIWQRYLGLLLDGLRAAAASPLPVAALTPGQLDTISPRKVS